MSNFATEQRYPLKLPIYRKVGHTSISIVTNYIDISRKMKYNRTVDRNYNRIYVQHNTNGKMAVYVTACDRLL